MVKKDKTLAFASESMYRMPHSGLVRVQMVWTLAIRFVRKFSEDRVPCIAEIQCLG